MTKPGKAEIVLVIDRSGSMQEIKHDMEGALQHFIAEQRKIPGDCTVTLTQFDNDYEVVYAGRPLAQVENYVLHPRGSTALLDAMGRTIQDVGARLASMAAHERPERVIMVVVTDGEENSSREYTRARIFDMIKHQHDVYGWDFIFLGTTQAAIHEAQGLGIVNNAVFVANAEGVDAFAGSTSAAVGAVRTRGGAVSYNQSVYDSFNAGNKGGQS